MQSVRHRPHGLLCRNDLAKSRAINKQNASHYLRMSSSVGGMGPAAGPYYAISDGPRTIPQIHLNVKPNPSSNCSDSQLQWLTNLHLSFPRFRHARRIRCGIRLWMRRAQSPARGMCVAPSGRGERSSAAPLALETLNHSALGGKLDLQRFWIARPGRIGQLASGFRFRQQEPLPGWFALRAR